MSHHSSDIIELPKTPNLKLVTDGNGDGWLCSGGANRDGDLESQGCRREDDVVYDRGFGG